MTMRFFNTYSRKIEEFEPRDPDGQAVSIYTCGPTVYSRAHIGNFRAYIFEDLLQRHLELRGYKVHRVMNITDVDDKTIRARAKQTWRCRNSPSNSNRHSLKMPKRCELNAQMNSPLPPTSVTSTG